MNQCKELVELPDNFGELETLRELDMTSCKSLCSLPTSFPHLLALRTLDLSNCHQLAILPQGFENLHGLRYLELNGCKKLAGHTAIVEELKNHGCKVVQTVAAEVGLRILDGFARARTASRKMRVVGYRGGSRYFQGDPKILVFQDIP